MSVNLITLMILRRRECRVGRDEATCPPYINGLLEPRQGQSRLGNRSHSLQLRNNTYLIGHLGHAEV